MPLLSYSCYSLSKELLVRSAETSLSLNHKVVWVFFFLLVLISLDVSLHFTFSSNGDFLLSDILLSPWLLRHNTLVVILSELQFFQPIIFSPVFKLLEWGHLSGTVG